MQQSQSIIKPFNKDIPVLFSLVFIVPIAITWLWCIYIKLFPLEQTIHVFTHPVILALCSAMTLFIALFYSVHNKAVRKYDGTESKVDYLNKMVTVLELGTVFLALLNSFIVPSIVTYGFRLRGMKTDFLPILLTFYGSTFLFSLSFYIIFFQAMQKQLKELPFERKHISFPIISRSIIVTVFSSIGLLLFVLSTFFSPAVSSLTSRQLIFQFLIPSGCLGVAAIIIDNYFQTKGNVDRVKEISDFSQSLADKNYTLSKLDILSRDEYGALSLDLNNFFNVTKELLKTISESVKKGVINSEGFVSDMEKTVSSTSNIVDRINEIQSRIENQTKAVNNSQETIKSMIEKISVLDQATNTQVSGISKSSKEIQDMVSNIKSVTEILEKNAQAVTDLRGKSETGRQKINDSVELTESLLAQSTTLMEASSIIQSIAEQTNLLAMNAAIEAAHAGESGKGFAVVADEIRKLSEESNQQGSIITNQLKEVQAAVSVISENTQRVQQEFEQIYELTVYVENKEIEIKNAMQVQNHGSENIIASINDITETATTIKEESQALIHGGSQIETEMKNLTEISDHLTKEINDITSFTSEIKDNTHRASDGAINSKKDYQIIQEEVNKFKLD